jgi:uncharacterized protein YxeA
MKKVLLSLSTLLLAAVMVVSCNKNSPKDVANTWLTSFYHMDYETAKKVSTDDTKNLISQLQQLTGMISDSSKAEMKKIVVTVKDVKENGDKAEVKYALSDSPTKDQSLELVKKDGKWLVQFSKNDQGAGAGDNAADQPAGADTTAPTGDAAMSDTVKH